VQRLDGPVSAEALRELKEEMEALNMRVERRFVEMESQIHARALVNTKGNVEEAENFNPHAGRYESDMKLALQSEVKRQEAEQERINEEMALLQTMEKYRQEYESQRESERKRVAAELSRQEVDKERTSQANELRALLQAASQAEKDRRRVEEELSVRISSFDRDLNRIAQEHDGMLEGFDEMKRLVKDSIERMEEHLKTNENEMYLELNKVRSQVFEAISRKEESRAVVISTNSSTTVIEGKDGLISIHSPRTSSDDEHGTGKRRNPVSPRKGRDADKRKNETMPFDGHRNPPSPLVPRLRLRRCLIDDAVPSSLRCATVVVGRRLFLFPQGQDGIVVDATFLLSKKAFASFLAMPTGAQTSRRPLSSPLLKRIECIRRDALLKWTCLLHDSSIARYTFSCLMCTEKSANCRAGMCLHVSLFADADAILFNVSGCGAQLSNILP